MIEIPEAFTLVLEHTRRLESKTAALSKTHGSVLAGDVTSDRDYPPFARAMMDGIAVRLADAGKHVQVVGVIAAGSVSEVTLKSGQAVEIMTGAPCPSDAEAVVPKELLEREGKVVKVPVPLELYQHIALLGCECRKGQIVASVGDVITPLVIANLASFGVGTVPVIQKPSMVIITTGSELLQPGEDLSPGRIRNTNGPMLESLALRVGVRTVVQRHVKDTLEDLRTILEETAGFDIVIFSGGVSAGKYDLVPNAIEQHGATLLFHKVRQKPGKPLLFAVKETQLVFGLPGTPLGSLFTFHRYVVPAIRKMSGRSPLHVAIEGTMAEQCCSNSDRPYFLLARAERHDGRWLIHCLKAQGASDIHAPARANACVSLPAGRWDIEAGTPVSFEFLGGVSEEVFTC